MTDDHRDDTSIRDFNNWADTAARSRNGTNRRSGTIKYATTSSNASSAKKSALCSSAYEDSTIDMNDE